MNVNREKFDRFFRDMVSEKVLILDGVCKSVSRRENGFLLEVRAEDGITNEEVLYLAGNSWAVNSISNLIIQGPCGSGKTALCCAIGANLCKAGISVRYYCWDDLVDEILTKSDSPSLFKNFKVKLSKYQVLIIDDVGLSESGIPKIVADTLFNVINKR